MKKFIIVIVLLAAAGGFGWLVWLKPAGGEETEKAPETDVPVRTAKIVRATLRGYVTAYGVVEAAPPGEQPAASARVASSVAGVVADVRCAEGERVEKGAVLFQLDSRAAAVAVEKALKAEQFAATTVDRQRKLLAVDGTSQKLLLEAEQTLAGARNDLAAAQTQQALLRIQAPLAGTVARILVKPGEAVDLATVLAEVIDLDRLVVSANVPSAELAGLQAGQTVEVLADNGAAPASGSLAFISPQIETKTGTAPIRIALPARSGLRPGQFVTLRIVTVEHKDCLAVPVESVVKDEADHTVIAVVQGDKAAQKPVKTGLRDAGLVEVEAEGLQPDMVVVTEGAYALPKETKVHLLDK